MQYTTDTMTKYPAISRRFMPHANTLHDIESVPFIFHYKKHAALDKRI